MELTFSPPVGASCVPVGLYRLMRRSGLRPETAPVAHAQVSMTANIADAEIRAALDRHWAASQLVQRL
ncbi:MAG TPA: hypothetical protein VGY54_01095 [Polyangiaceae bacterium]|nr:hypothetical protein [Polyangiaceae bacterium]